MVLCECIFESKSTRGPFLFVKGILDGGLAALVNNSGMTLKAFMKLNIIDLQTFFIISLTLTELLSKLHQKGVIRYNLNPDYIFMDQETGSLTFLPLYTSQSIPSDERASTPQDELIQAYAYMSPEQTGRMKRKIDPRSDLYALGVLMYELLTGVLPYYANTANEWIHAHMALLPVPPWTIKARCASLLREHSKRVDPCTYGFIACSSMDNKSGNSANRQRSCHKAAFKTGRDALSNGIRTSFRSAKMLGSD